MEPDDVLARRAQAGDRAAFEELVRRTTRLVYARLYVETGDVHRTEDLVQETFLRAWRAISNLLRPEGFRGWLLSIAESAALDDRRRRMRKKRASPGMEGGEALETVAAAEGNPGEEAESRTRILGILRALPDPYRMPLTLRYIEGADYDQITKSLGLTNGSLRGLLHRGLTLLRELMINPKT